MSNFTADCISGKAAVGALPLMKTEFFQSGLGRLPLIYLAVLRFLFFSMYQKYLDDKISYD